jgi:hypothetical protein
MFANRRSAITNRQPPMRIFNAKISNRQLAMISAVPLIAIELKKLF